MIKQEKTGLKRPSSIFRFFSLLSVIFIIQIFLSFPVFAANLYWENPQTISNVDSRFPTVANNDKGVSVVIWEEITSNGNIYLSGKISKNNTWSEINRFAGPYSYSGEVPNIFSVAIIRHI